MGDPLHLSVRLGAQCAPIYTKYSHRLPQIGTGWGAGLRQHHNRNGVTVCLNCHADADPDAFTPAGEDIMPPWYASVLNTNTGTNLAPCNANLEEDLSGDPLNLGLDNDGDLDYDGNDPDCQAVAVCGNSIVETGEDCDDGNTEPGDCCSDTCQFEPSGSSCADGLFCNGDETCDGLGSCQAGTTVDCNDNVGCTDDSCDEAADACVSTPDNAFCDNGQFCDGVEICDAVADCQPGTPVDCNDGVGCTEDACDEAADACVNTPNDANCPDDGLFCNGAEFCDAQSDCSSTGDPCPADTACNETGDLCEEVCVPTANKEKGKKCSDGIDNDCDGLVDDFDPDCARGGGGAKGEGKGKTCRDGIDNDGDTLIDCADPDCANSRDCP